MFKVMCSAAGRSLAAVWVVATLAACGGGGGGGDPAPTSSTAPSGPPATAAAVSNTPSDAIDLTKATVAAADGLVSRQGSLSALTALTGVPVSSAQAGPLSLFHTAPAGMKRALAVTTEPCTDALDPPCSGTLTVDTDIAVNATRASAGQYASATFNSISGSIGGVPVSFSGGLRLEFLSAFNFNASSLAGFSMRIKLNGFAGSVGGTAFGPFSETMDLVFDAQSVPTLTANGARYGALSGVSVTGANAYRIDSGSVRLGYGSTAAGYVDVSLRGWSSRDGRPVSGSFASVDVPGWTTSVSVVSSSATTVLYDVSIVGSVPGSTRLYRVTATYPAGGGAPTYTAAPG
jgi:hypothetical protein